VAHISSNLSFKEVVDDSDPTGGEGFQKFIMNAIRARGSAIREFSNTLLNERGLHEVPEGLSIVLHGLGRGEDGVGI